MKLNLNEDLLVDYLIEKLFQAEIIDYETYEKIRKEVKKDVQRRTKCV